MNPEKKPVIDIGGGTKKAYDRLLIAYPVLKPLIRKLNGRNGRIGIGAVAAFIIGSIVWAHIKADQSAAMYTDIQRVSNLQQLNLALQEYYRDLKVLPGHLRDLEQRANPAYMRDGYMFDPQTHQPFEYDVIDDNDYQICAVFRFSTQEIIHRVPTDLANPVWDHERGPHCFHFNPPEVKDSDKTLVP